MSEDLIEINQQITHHIKELLKARNQLAVRVEDKANALGVYEEKVAQIMLKMRNTGEYEGNKYSTATGLEKVAKGLAYKESIALSLAEDKLKNIYYVLNVHETIINALQSKLKYIKYDT